MTTTRLAILLSGRGSNFAAIHDAIGRGILPAEIVAVISNRAAAPGIELARQRNLPTHLIDHSRFASREAHESAVMAVLDEARPDFIVLAGYMRLLTSSFIARYPNRIVNIHPSLLPAFAGVNAQEQALRYGVKVTGCTVHFVDENLDAGRIILQRCVTVESDDDVDTLSSRILEQEHIAYVEALALLTRGNFQIEGRRVKFLPSR